MRETLSVGYLLARATDTIADCSGEASSRLNLLSEFREEWFVVNDSLSGQLMERLEAIAREDGVSEGESILMSRFSEVMGWWAQLEEEKKEATRQVIEKISEGQYWDVSYFTEGELTAVQTRAQVLQYCDWVAGSVGEFWTEIGFLAERYFSARSKDELCDLGRNYGRGLQLVNILRDEEEDQERGRVYLVGKREEWAEEAARYLQDGLTYSRALKGKRIRMASVLPALLGLETISKMRDVESWPEKPSGKVKVTRKVARNCLWKAFWFR